MSTHPHTVITKARELYLKYQGRDHRAIEHEMHLAGCLTFTRRVLYNRTYKNGKKHIGWIDQYGWRDALRNADAPVRMSAKHEPDLKQDQQDKRGESAAQAETRVAGSVLSSPSPVHPVNSSSFPSWLKTVSSNMTWHWEYQQLIYDKLQQVTDGTCKRLMIFLPPRHGKSELVTVRYSAWRLLNDPKLNIILGSYNQRLANRFSRKVRITLEDAQLKQAEEETRKDERLQTRDKRLAAYDSTSRSQEGGFTPASSSSDPRDPRSSAADSVSALTPASRRRLNTVSEWETGLGGGVRAVGVGGGITGFGADLVIIDDPVRSRAEAESRTYRDKTYEWFCDDLYTRLEPNASIILIQTRWHEDDLAGRLLKDSEEEGAEKWEVISLPALAEDQIALNKEKDDNDDDENNVKPEPVLLSPDGTVIDPPARPVQTRLYFNREEWKEYDQKLSEYQRLLDEQLAREKEERDRLEAEKKNNPQPVDILGRFKGMPLCPERFSKEDLLRIKRKLGSYSFSALYQQRPTPPEGGLFKRKWFSRIVDRAPEGLKWVRAYDLAISTRDNADYTASFRCALDRKTGELYISDGFRKRIEFPEQKHLIIQKMYKEPNTEHGIEEALHGLAFIQELRREHRLFGCAFRGIRVTKDKFTRALSWANLAEEGKVILVKGPWIEDFLDEVTTFPNSTHDDQIDAISLAVQMLQRRKFAAFGF
jgi:predicted phage terminase large subunit-like protein